MYAFLCLKYVLEGCAGTCHWWLLWESNVLVRSRGEGHHVSCSIVSPRLIVLPENHFSISHVILNGERKPYKKKQM